MPEIHYSPHVLGLAKGFMQRLLAPAGGLLDEGWGPTDFDRHLLGITVDLGVLDLALTGTGRLAFNSSIFGVALGELVKEGKVEAHQDRKGWRYRLRRAVPVAWRER